MPALGKLIDEETPPSNIISSLLGAREGVLSVGSGSSEKNMIVFS